MLGNVIAVIIGIIVGMALYMGTFILLDQPGEGVEFFFRFIRGQIPADVLFLLFFMGGFIMVTLNSFCGARVAARLGSSRPMLLAMIVGSSLTVVDLWGLTFVHMQLVLGPFPVLLNLGGAWVAGIMEQKRRAAAEAPAPPPAETAKAESNEKQH